MAMGAGNGGGPDAVSVPVADARKGEELFGRNCQQCHNSRGKGGKGPQLVKGAWAPGGANSDDYMFKVIADGRPNTQMGGWRNSLSEQEMRQIVTFLREEAKRVAITDQKSDPDDEGQWY
ncbi:cytochrome c [Methyloversatilis sp.]|uniref:c-type cytochrome n=1 Tax=Methyloversatilis sp. TaxID=2569862 RepID=UPI00273649D2|nr:cytochrome c [Methyloversatilis sp.]MDP2869481.1 cytochrome c [Methyloversatilis sp.]MDP3290376.1 cytochrome c [Methyloversatilis sp.]MDP3455245.1 cytochrome c [Methyloversatilis sp.]MDP3578439.1 cytochrome c [Methyloversatilis sp.]